MRHPIPELEYSPTTYAQGLAYLGDPVKIRNRTELYWGKGRAPSLKTIERFVAEREKRRNRAIGHTSRVSALRGAGSFPELRSGE